MAFVPDILFVPEKVFVPERFDGPFTLRPVKFSVPCPNGYLRYRLSATSIVKLESFVINTSESNIGKSLLGGV